jgi:hypothetical protein
VEASLSSHPTLLLMLLTLLTEPKETNLALGHHDIRGCRSGSSPPPVGTTATTTPPPVGPRPSSWKEKTPTAAQAQEEV